MTLRRLSPFLSMMAAEDEIAVTDKAALSFGEFNQAMPPFYDTDVGTVVFKDLGEKSN